MNEIHYQGPIVLVVMDGVGLAADGPGNAVSLAHTDFLDYAQKNYLNIPLLASGEAVGILAGDMGNSEVGHNALGSGQIIKQGIAQIEEAFATGTIFQSEAWRAVINNLKSPDEHEKTLHFSGIFSDGNVHSSIKHLEHLIKQAHAEGVKKIRFHLVLDGRDVPPQSEPKYIDRLEAFVKPFNEAGCDYRIASGCGRMVAVADRYESNWDMVKQGWEMMVHGRAEYQFHAAREAILTLRQKEPDLQDQYFPTFVITNEQNEAVGKVQDGDSFIYIDFRADRAVEIAQAFTETEFTPFDRGTEGNRPLRLTFAGLTEYNLDKHIPNLQLVRPVEIHDPLNIFLSQHNISQLAVSETVKFGHITYYFNGNSYAKAPGEEHIKIESDTLPFDTRPWMKAAEITDAVLEHLNQYQFIRINYPGGDMVGHFAEVEPTITAMEAIDLSLARIAKKVDELGGMMIITADHGNAEELLDAGGQPKTSHSTNKVPCIFYDNTPNRDKYVANTDLADPGLSNVAASIATLFGLSELPAAWRSTLIRRA